jgi:hemerythrin-like domain-containing protein
MPGPIDSLRFVHTALEREILSLEELVTAASTPDQAAALKDRFDFLERLGHGHTSGEEVGLFPALDEKIPGFSKTYVFDHGDERAAFARMQTHLEGCAKGDTGALRALAREVTKFADHLTRHIRKENELVLPAINEHFSREEQLAMIGKIVGKMSPDEMAAGVPFITGWLDHDDRVAYVGILQRSVPEPAFRALAGRIKGRLDESSFAALAKAIPALM